MNKFEQLIEYVINDEEKAARDLFHQIVVDKSREIYENLMAEEEFGDDIDGLQNDVDADEQGFSEEDDIAGEEGIEGDDFGGEEDFGDESETMDMEDRVVDLEDKLDELMAEFETLVGSEGDDSEFDDEGTDDFGGDMGDDLEDDTEFDAEEGDDDMQEESFVREYTEKVAAPAKGEGQEVGKAGSSVSVNKQSTVAKPNPLGNVANAKNLNQGGSNPAPDGTAATKKPNNPYSKGEGKLTTATTKPAQKQVDSLRKI
jgi:hypothetical protein